MFYCIILLDSFELIGFVKCFGIENRKPCCMPYSARLSKHAEFTRYFGYALAKIWSGQITLVKLPLCHRPVTHCVIPNSRNKIYSLHTWSLLHLTLIKDIGQIASIYLSVIANFTKEKEQNSSLHTWSLLHLTLMKNICQITSIYLRFAKMSVLVRD